MGTPLILDPSDDAPILRLARATGGITQWVEDDLTPLWSKVTRMKNRRGWVGVASDIFNRGDVVLVCGCKYMMFVRDVQPGRIRLKGRHRHVPLGADIRWIASNVPWRDADIIRVRA